MNKLVTLALALLVQFVVAGCSVATDSDTDNVGKSDLHATLAAHEAARILALVNYPGTDLALLDDDVRLDSRAAENIVAHRNGPDGISPSDDDSPFQSLAELVAIKFVGDVALHKLNDYAALHPSPPSELAEGVEFLGWQREAVLWGVNVASEDGLRSIGLNSTQAKNLVQAAPYESLVSVGNVPQIGPAALGRLRDAAGSFWHAMKHGPVSSMAGTYDGVTFDHDTAEAALEIAALATHAQLVSGGVYSAGATAIVNGRPFTDLAAVASTSGVGKATMQALHDYAVSGAFSAPSQGTKQEDEECDANSECAEGLICAGATMNYGICRPDWMGGTFHSTATQAIPDNNATGIVSKLQVTGLASVPEDVIIHLDIDHPRVSDLRVVLQQPGYPEGASAVIWQPGSTGPATVVVTWGIERDAQVNGEWKLFVVDTKTGEVGSLKGWSLELTSRWD